MSGPHSHYLLGESPDEQLDHRTASRPLILAPRRSQCVEVLDRILDPGPGVGRVHPLRQPGIRLLGADDDAIALNHLVDRTVDDEGVFDDRAHVVVDIHDRGGALVVVLSGERIDSRIVCTSG